MHSMVNVDTASQPEAVTAQALVILADSGRAITEIVKRRAGHDVLASNTAMMAAALIWLNGPMRPGELAEALDITTGGSTKIVSRLEECGIVSKGPEGYDGRAVFVSLTEEGKRSMASVLSAVAPAVRDLVLKLARLEVAT
jgi:DNA-binding MarR family transcriptional regulator